MKKFMSVLTGAAVVAAGLFISVPDALAASKGEIDAGVNATLNRFYSDVLDSKDLVNRAKGVLVFPSVLKAGLGIGGEYGEGALQIDGETVDYYSTAAASIGLQLGAQKKSIILLFMEDGALDKFKSSKGWKAGVDASVALVNVGAGGAMDTTQTNKPVIGFVFGQAGLMYNLSLEGAKFTKIYK